jgi:branched-chain amino acid aminotransferase
MEVREVNHLLSHIKTPESMKQITLIKPYKFEERDVYINQLHQFEEIGACGTAASVTPIYEVSYKNKVIYQKDSLKIGLVTQLLFKTITDIYFGNIVYHDKWIISI